MGVIKDRQRFFIADAFGAVLPQPQLDKSQESMVIRAVDVPQFLWAR